MEASPGHYPTLLTSWEQATRLILSASGRSGARRPENRVTAKVKDAVAGPRHPRPPPLQIMWNQDLHS